MDIKVNGTKGPSQADKKKKTGKTDPNAPSFASFLEETESAAAPTQAEGTTATPSTVLPPFTGQEDIPQEPQQHGAYLLEQLEELERDILSGTPTQAVEKLKQALEHSPLENADLTDSQRETLDELHLRASIEVAKLEE